MIKKNQTGKISEHPYSNDLWSTLNDTQKTKLILESKRMLDEETFLQEFGSFEQPEFNNSLNTPSNEQ